MTCSKKTISIQSDRILLVNADENVEFEKAPDMLAIILTYESRYKQTLHSIETRLYELDKYSAYRRPLSAYDAGRYLELAAMYYSLTGTIWEIAK